MWIEITASVEAGMTGADQGLAIVPPHEAKILINLDHVAWAFISDNMAALNMSSGHDLVTKVPEEIEILRQHIAPAQQPREGFII